jgi:hypothetical protein
MDPTVLELVVLVAMGAAAYVAVTVVVITTVTMIIVIIEPSRGPLVFRPPSRDCLDMRPLALAVRWRPA